MSTPYYLVAVLLTFALPTAPRSQYDIPCEWTVWPLIGPTLFLAIGIPLPSCQFLSRKPRRIAPIWLVLLSAAASVAVLRVIMEVFA